MTDLPANAQTRTFGAVRPARATRAPAILGPLLVIVMDTAAIWLAFWCAYLLRYRFEFGGVVFSFNQRAFSDFTGRIALFVILFVVIALVRGVYRLSTWTSLLDGGKVEGGHWQTEIHDFMSLPLMVRPGTVLPLYCSPLYFHVPLLR
mgnify:CR=1 FL=1